MLLNLFRWFFGYVRFSVIGKFPERFINIVTKSRFSIWDTKNIDGTLYGCMYVRDYKKIRPLAHKSRVRLKVCSRHGLPFYIRRYKARVGVLVGIAVFALVVFFMSNFVWTIDIVGLQTISEAQLREVLKDNGLYIGTYKPSVSFKVIARDTMLDLDDIGWMSINVINSNASVELKEKAKSPKVEDYHKPANVKAERDGLILSINTREGKALFEKGSAVVKDQMIVSGVIENALGGVRFVRADAQVMAQTTHGNTFSVDKQIHSLDVLDIKTRRNLEIFTLNIPVTFCFADDSESIARYHTNSLTLFDTTLPLSIVSKNLYEKSYHSVIIKEKQAQIILQKQAALSEMFSLSECTVTNREFNFTNTNSNYILDVTYTCTENIAYQQDINIDNLTLENTLPTEAQQ